MKYKRYSDNTKQIPFYKLENFYSNTFNIYDFLKTEFLNADNLLFNQVASHYFIHYGESAYQYLLKTHSSWQSGKVKTNVITMTRILECVPKYLSTEKRLFILKIEIQNFLEKIKKKVIAKINSDNDIFQIYYELQNEILEFNHKDLHWFIGKNILTKNELDSYSNIIKYSLNERLKQSFNQVKSDFKMIKIKLADNYFIDESHYFIDFLNFEIKLNKLNFDKLEEKEFNQINLNLENSITIIGEKYMIDSLKTMDFYNKTTEINQILALKDLEMFLSSVFVLIKKSNSFNVDGIFQGKGGLLKIKIEYHPYIKSIKKITSNLFTIILINFFGSVLNIYFYKHKFYMIFAFIFIIVAIVNLFKIIDIIENTKLFIKTTKLNRNYGRK